MSRAHQIVADLLETDPKELFFDVMSAQPIIRKLKSMGYTVRQHGGDEYWSAWKVVPFADEAQIMIATNGNDDSDVGGSIVQVSYYEWLPDREASIHILDKNISSANIFPILEISEERLANWAYDNGMPFKDNVIAALHQPVRESSAKDLFMQWTGDEGVGKTLESQGWTGKTLADRGALYTRVIDLNNGMKLVGEIHPAWKDHWWHVSLWDTHGGHQLAFPDIHEDRIEQFASDMVDILGIFSDPLEMYNGRLDSMTAEATDDLFRAAQRWQSEQVSESMDLKAFAMDDANPYDTDPVTTLKNMGFKPGGWYDGAMIKMVPLPRPFDPDAKFYHHKYKYDNVYTGGRSLFDENPHEDKSATRAAIVVTGERNSHGTAASHKEWKGWNRLEISVMLGGGMVADASRRVSAQKSTGDLSTRLVNVIGALERAIQSVDPSRYNSHASYAEAVNRAWGKQPNQLRRKKK